MDRFFVSYNFEEEMFLHANLSMLSSSIRTHSRRYSLMKHDVKI